MFHTILGPRHLVFLTDKYTFDKGVSRCSDLGGVLAAPTSNAELSAYIALMKEMSIEYIWVGIKDDGNTVQTMTYLNGKPEPTLTSINCMFHWPSPIFCQCDFFPFDLKRIIKKLFKA